MNLNFIILSQAIVFILNLGFGFFVFFKNPKNAQNIAFFFISLGAGFWIFSLFLTILKIDYIIWGKLAFSFAALMIGAIAYFINLLSNKKFKIWKKSIIIGIACLFIVLPLLPGVIISITPIQNYITGTFGPAFNIWFLFWIIAIIYIITKSIKNFRNASVIIDKKKAKIIILAISLFIIPQSITNLFIPILFSYFNLNNIGPLFSIFMVSLIGYSIIKYHLFDIWIIIRLGTIYAILFTIISFIFVFLSSLISQVVPGPLSLLLPSFLITIGFIPLKNFIEFATDKIFFRRKFRTEEFINQFNLIVRRSKLSLDNLLGSFNQLIIDYVRVERSAICLLIPKDGFISRQIIGSQLSRIEFPPDHPIANFLLNNPKEIIDKEIIKNNAVYGDIVKELENINFSLVIPMELKGQLIGIYLIGRKKSQDSFTNEEIGLLKLLATESAFAIDNARLFEDLKTIDEAKSKFISVVSHQLRTPLTSIRWNLELIINENLEQETNKELMNNIYKSVIFLTDHLDDMLTALDIEERKIEPKKEKNDFGKVIKETMEQYASEIKSKNLSFILPLLDEIKPFSFDLLKIKKAISIILRNAILYSRPSEKIKISVEIKEINKISNLIFSISDEGLGLIEDEKKNIFGKFYRSEEAKRISPNGFGLGLFIAKHFIEAHNGKFWFSSEGRNKGAAFHFSLPINPI